MARSVEGYRLYAQILSQPAALERLLSAPEPVEQAASLLAAGRRVFTIGIGTSSNAAAVAAAMLSAAGLDTQLWSSFDFSVDTPELRADDAAVVFSHSGRKQYSRRALELLRDAAVPTVWIASTEAEPNEATVVLRTVKRETSAAFTVSHTAAMLVAARVADAVRPGSVGELQGVPGAVRRALELEPDAASLAEQWADAGSIYAIGAGSNEPSAHEIAIKLNEAARMRCRGYAAEQFLHGPQAQVQPGDAFVIFATPGGAFERIAVVAQFALDIGAAVAWIAPVEGPSGVQPLIVTDVGELLAPVVQAVPGQLLAAHLAAQRDVDADSFRLDDPPFKRAFERYEL